MAIQRKQKTPPGASLQGAAVKPPGPEEGLRIAAAQTGRPSRRNQDIHLLEKMLERNNMRSALKRVRENKGAPGVDGMTVHEAVPFLRTNWERIRGELLSGTYRPTPVKRVEIPKPGGGKRLLGIPTVTDRLIQQALLQVLSPIIDPLFCDSSYGFRPKRSAHQAVLQARQYVEEGWSWVVDLDLEKFFDRVNHDILMSRLARYITDKRVLHLIRLYLQAGVMLNGVVTVGEEGTPQGGPLSPLLSNVMLHDLDEELMRRGHRFCRYADDCNVYVRSRRAGERLKTSLTTFLDKRLKLTVNEAKSAVDRPWRRKFLGYSMYPRKGGVGLRLAPSTLARAKSRIRSLTRASRSSSLSHRIEGLNRYLRGWLGYFILADARTHYQRLDEWVRSRLRMVLWRQWKRPRARYRELRAHGYPHELAYPVANARQGPWRMAHNHHLLRLLGLSFWRAQGLQSLEQRYLQLRSV